MEVRELNSNALHAREMAIHSQKNNTTGAYQFLINVVAMEFHYLFFQSK